MQNARINDGDWPFIREQFKIEFGREMHTEYGGMIMNLMMSIHELVDEAKETK
jgi:hypothetical protein